MPTCTAYATLLRRCSMRMDIMDILNSYSASPSQYLLLYSRSKYPSDRDYQ